MPGSLVKLILLLPLCWLIYQHQAAAHDLDGSVFRMSPDGSSVERLSEVGAAAPIWAPDGQRILYVLHSEDETAFLVISASGKVLMRIPVPSPITAVGGVSWFPDGTEIAFAGKTGEAEASYDIYRMRLGAQEPAIRLIVEDGIQPALSPGGQLLVFTTNRDGNLDLYLAGSDGRNRFSTG